ncbi:MAG: hypothetical protein M1828_002786 [Chrysothrix sp. TS-e1954]|nr:MAG: hypothetical protein M1828_002786 [Chrysothrix sp. TS-e1954]
MAVPSEPSAAQPTNTPPYYQSICEVRNFDDPEDFDVLYRMARDERSHNFVLDHGRGAWCGFDVDEQQMHKLLSNEGRPRSAQNRWIHIWAPDRQVALVREVAKHFDFSPRLTGLMCSQSSSTPRAQVQGPEQRHPFAWRGHYPHWPGSHDEEKVISMSSSHSEQSFDLLHDLDHYQVVDTIWHWSSVDMGSKYFCIGYNSLYHERNRDEDNKSDKPAGKRLWTWLILCSDRTVISIVEGAEHRIMEDSNATFKDASALRRNMLNVFRQISKASDTSPRNPIFLVPVRPNTNGGENNARNVSSDACGMLFYYLFDDWYTSYSLLAKQEHQYGSRLNDMRQRMFEHADLDHVNRLNHIGRQLAVLKRLYQSYELIIDRILEKQKKPPASIGPHCSVPVAAEGEKPEDEEAFDDYDSLGIYLTSAARVRFERLRDRIRLYALSEIQECADMKESMVTMNMHLITMKESDAVERLTRITILLAKATLLFLPVSLMTAYFSTTLTGVNFTVAKYWISFAVIIVFSFAALLVFGQVSGTIEGKMVYRSVGRAMWDKTGKRLMRLSK